LNQEHPRNADGKPYGLYESIFDVDTGYHFCGDTSINTDTGTMGIGISLYFKFLKYLICMFLLFTVLSIPSIYFSSLSIFVLFIDFAMKLKISHCFGKKLQIRHFYKNCVCNNTWWHWFK